MQARALPVAQGGDTWRNVYEKAVKETGAGKMLCNKVQEKMGCEKVWEQCLRKWPRKKSFKSKGNAGGVGVPSSSPIQSHVPAMCVGCGADAVMLLQSSLKKS